MEGKETAKTQNEVAEVSPAKSAKKKAAVKATTVKASEKKTKETSAEVDKPAAKKKAVENAPTKSARKNAAPVATTAKVWVEIFRTNYHRYRHHIRFILLEGKVNGFRFVKDEIGWTGRIAVDKPEVAKAKLVLADYKTNNPEIVDMWWK